jgi:hypothetical protein
MTVHGRSDVPGKPILAVTAPVYAQCGLVRIENEGDSSIPGKQNCRHCLTLGIPCTYDYQPKKRGPPNLYLRRLQEAAAAATAAPQPQKQESPVRQDSEVTSNRGVSPHVSSPLVTKSPVAFLEPSLPHPTGVPGASSLPPSRYPIAADTYHHGGHYPHPPQSPTYSAPRSAIEPQNGQILLHHASPKTEESPSYPPDSYNNNYTPQMFGPWSYKQPQVMPIPPPQVVPPLSYYYRPRRLEEIAPRDTISLIIALFFDFVYPLTPCIHKPSFMADLHSRREERDPLFFALVMSTVASTLVQVPRSYLPMERPVVRKLAQVGPIAQPSDSTTNIDIS